MNSDVRALARVLRDQGLQIVQGGKHLRVEDNGVLVGTLPITPSDHRWRANAVRAFIRQGVLKEDPFSGRTSKKEEKEMAGNPAVTQEHSDLVKLLFHEIAEVEGLSPPRAGRKVPYGSVPALEKAVKAAWGAGVVTMPEMTRHGRSLDWQDPVEAEFGLHRLCSRLATIAGDTNQPTAYPSTIAFIDVATRAWEWWTTPQPATEPAPEVIEVEDVLYVQAETDVTTTTPLVVTNLPPEAKPLVVWNEMPKNGLERTDLAIRVAAAVGGNEGVKLAREVMDL